MRAGILGENQLSDFSSRFSVFLSLVF